jgi:cell division transport system permease protein
MANVGVFQVRRVVRYGLQNFWRNIGLSVATTFVTMLTLVAVSLIVIINLLLGIALKSVESRVDVSVFFDPLASTDQINQTRAEVVAIQGVQHVEVISREQALQDFKSSHAQNALIVATLDELEQNPLQTTLVIYANTPDEYAHINQELAAKVDGQIIDRVNYDDNRSTIERLSRISKWARTGGISASAVLGAIAILVVFNTVRLTIYSRREEIGIMKLVGATNGYIRGPFVIEGVLYGLLASFVTVSILQPLLLWVSPQVESFFGTSSAVFDFVRNNLALVIAGEVGAGVLLGMLSSSLAIHRYLRV